MYQVLVTKEDGNTFAANVTEDQYGFLTSNHFFGFSVEIYSEKVINESHGKYGKFKTYRELIRWLSCADNKDDVELYERVVGYNFDDYMHDVKALRTCKYILTYEYFVFNPSSECVERIFEKIKENLMGYIHRSNATKAKCREFVRYAMCDYINTH